MNTNAKGLLIILLIGAVAVLGYLYYQEQQRDVTLEIEVPKVDIE